MKRYLLFIGTQYHSCGGIKDFVSDYNTLEEAIDAFEKNRDNGTIFDKNEIWSHIYDTETKKIVWEQ